MTPRSTPPIRPPIRPPITPRITLIAAIGRHRELGLDNQLLWRLPADLAHFKARTLGRPIVMGRKTHESIGRPLPGRLNIVISRDPDYRADGCAVANSVDQALELASGAEEVMIIGGAAIYALFLPNADSIELTEVDGEFKADAFFPAWNADDWHETANEAHAADERNPLAYRFVTLQRQP